MDVSPPMQQFALHDRDALKEYVLGHGCYSPEENERIYSYAFHGAPRLLFRSVDRIYQLSQRVIADVGCAYGQNLLFCRPGSYGFEFEEYYTTFAQALGLPVYRRNVVDEDISDLPKVDAVWCAAVTEHVDSPHILLRKLHVLLKPGGLVFILVPLVPIIPALSQLRLFRDEARSYLAADHVNFFTPMTLRMTCERAGFRTVEISPFYPGIAKIMNQVPFFDRLFNFCVYVGEKIDGWEYATKATRRVNEKQGRVFKMADSPSSTALHLPEDSS